MGSGQSNRRASAVNATAPTTVWWDVENCLPPSGMDAYEIGNRIRASLRALGYVGPVEITGVVSHKTKLVKRVRKRFKEPGSGVTIYSCRDIKKSKQVSDNEIKRRMHAWRAMNIHPRNALLISGDEDFLAESDILRRDGYNVMLAYRPDAASENVKNSAATHWTWHMLLGWTPCKPPKRQRFPRRSPSPPPKRRRSRFAHLAGFLGC